MAAVDYFLKIDGIDGESTSDKHKGEIDVLSFSWGLSQSGSFASGGGGGAGKVQFQDFHFTANESKASPNLFLKCATGHHLKFAVLTAQRGGESQIEFMHIKFEDVLISSYQTGGSQNSFPMDQVSLNFGRIAFSFTTQDATGKPGETVRAGWDLKQNRAV
jgi:type VI secretion system secreted protein Hcp